MPDTKPTPYDTLLEKIATLGQRQLDTFGEQIKCKAGCYSCCRPPDSLFQVEAETLLQGVSLLSESDRAIVTSQLQAYEQHQRELCPLLDVERGGLCLVYTSRPAICRTHGFAMWFRNTEEASDNTEESEETDVSEDTSPTGSFSWCELNFTEVQPTKDDAFDGERLNVMLSLITQLGWPQQPARRPLVETIRAGLATTTGEGEA
jgi:Fe-S-cluster containining protein